MILLPVYSLVFVLIEKIYMYQTLKTVLNRVSVFYILHKDFV